MKKAHSLCLAMVFALVFAFSGSVAFAEEKIGFFSMEHLMKESVEGKKALDEIQKMAEKSQTAITNRENELRKLKEELEKQGNLMKPDVLREKETTYQQKIRDYQILVRDSEEELRGKQQEIASAIYPEITKIVQSIGAKEKYTMIINISVIPVDYLDMTKDLTPRIIAEFNRTYKPKK
jgi:outer membrane protein